MARHHHLDEEHLEQGLRSAGPGSADLEQVPLTPDALPGLAGANVSDRARLLQAMQQGAGNQAVLGALAADARVGADGGALDPALSSELDAGRAGGRPIDHSVRSELESGLGTELNEVRIHTDGTADRLSRQLSAKAFTSGSDVFFRRGAYDPGSEAGRALLGHEVAHVVQQGGRAAAGPLTVAPAHSEHESTADAASATIGKGGKVPAGPALSGAMIARQTDADELEAAADLAANQDTLSTAAAAVTNVPDVNAAKAAKARVAAGSEQLNTAAASKMAGAEVEPQHHAANAQIMQLLDFYIGFSTEETRTGVDFIDRYKQAHGAFARLQATAVEYEQLTGDSATKSTDLLSAETGAGSGNEAKRLFGGLGGASNPAALAAVTSSRDGLSQTETAMKDVKLAVDNSATLARTGFRDVVNATATMKQKAEENNAKDKAAEVTKVKADIAQLQTWISTGIDTAMVLGTAGVPAGAAAFGASPASHGGGAALLSGISAGSDAAVLKGKDMAFDQGKKYGAEAVTGFSEFVATKTYEQELKRAETGLEIANRLASGYAAEIGGNQIRTAIDLWQQNLRNLRDKSAEFDRLQQVLRTQITQVGQAMEAAGMGKQEGARFTVIAEFRTEATQFVNQADLALTLGRQYRATVDEAGGRRGAAAYKDDKSRIWYDAYNGYDGRWRLRMNYLDLGIRLAAGENGSIETVDSMLQELQTYRDNADRYRSDTAKAMGGTP